MSKEIQSDWRPTNDAIEHLDINHDPRDHLAHHFDTPKQQFEAAKLGMWLFLGTELLLFGGLFCLYSVLRGIHPEIFEFGSQFLDTRWGIINTAVLITSSLTMAVGVTAAQQGRYRLLVSMLVATFIGATTFMTIKYIEYHHKIHEGLIWGTSFYDAPDWAIAAERHRQATEQHDANMSTGVAASLEATPYVPDVDHGRELWNATCRSCHGVAGEGVAGQGKDIRNVEFITAQNDDEILAFLKIGRIASHPQNTTGIAMPPKGGNPLLTDDDLRDVIALLRTFNDEATPGDSDSPVAAEEFWIPTSSIPPAPNGPAGTNMAWFDPEHFAVDDDQSIPHHTFDIDRPDNAHLFFGVYFLMTGLHGFHVVFGMVVIGWLTFRAIRRDFGPNYFTPVDLGGLYWHVVDIIWIFLFPLLYLIG